MLHKGWGGMFLSGMVGTASGGSEKKYKITNYSAYIAAQEEAEPGAFVTVTTVGKGVDVATASGKTVPCLEGAAFQFVMPAEDVVVSD